MILSVVIWVFISIIISDIIWVFYIKYTAGSEKHKAGISAAAIYIFGGFVVIAFTSNPLYLIPASIGAYIGTVLAIIIHDKIERKKQK